MRSNRYRAAVVLGCALAAVLVTSIAAIPTLRRADWSLTVLPRVNGRTALGRAARAIDPGFHTVRTEPYDGAYYWGIAVDPVGRGTVHQLFDKPSYRYGHPLFGWVGWVLSAGHARTAATALAAAGIASVVAAVVAATLLCLRGGTSGLRGLIVAFNPGLIGSAIHDLGEPLATALLLWGLFFYLRGRRLTTWFAFALAPLAKEPLALMVLAAVAWECFQRRWSRAAVFATALCPAVAWWTYARMHFGAWFISGGTALGRPFAGWRSAFAHSTLHVGEPGAATRVAAVAILAALVVVLTLAFLRALSGKGVIELTYIALFGVASCLAPNATVAVGTAFRNTTFLLALAPVLIAAPSLAPLAIESEAATENSTTHST